MTKLKDTATAFLSIFVMVSGVALSFLSFFTAPRGEVSQSVLWYVAQCMLYSGALLTGRMILWQQLTKMSDEINRALHAGRTDEQHNGDPS